MSGNKMMIDDGLQCLMIIASFYHIPADPVSLSHDLALTDRKWEASDIIRGAKRLKIRSAVTHVTRKKLSKASFPMIICIDNSFAVLAKANDEKCMILFPKETRPSIISTSDLYDKWDGTAILMIPRNIRNEDIKFGFRWFIPTIMKYKGTLIEVLIAAFVMQLIGLCSPLITQSVIDKVLVHNSLSTLDVLAIALVIISVFEAALGMARSYVFCHTASKIDVILSSRLFEHLFALPLSYFENRRVGDTVARMRELENIRRFLTGVPMNTLIDSLFIIIYILVMLLYSKTLTGITILSIPVLALLSLAVTPVIKSRLDDKFACGAAQQSYLVESVTGVQTIKSSANEPQVQKKWGSILADYTRANFKVTTLSSFAGQTAQFIEKITDIIILWYGAHLVINRELTVGQLVAFRMLSGRVSGPVLRLVQMWQDFQQTKLSVERIGDIFNTKKESKSSSSQ